MIDNEDRKGVLKMKIIIAVCITIFCIPALCIGEEFKIPKTFKSGQKIIADDFNQNFEKIEKEIVALRKSLEEVEKNMTPKGTVAAFDLNKCPIGWEEYERAYGRFIRGIDKSGKAVDPEGLRKKGSRQEDDFNSHQHGYMDIYWAESDGGFKEKLAGSKTGTDWDNKGFQMPRDSKSAGGKETRPKNVSLLYCIKN